MRFSWISRVLLVILATTAIGCGGGGGGGSGGGIGGTGAALDVGTVRFALTDAPSCGYDQVNVTVDRVRVNQSATAADSDAGWYDIALAPPQRVDLLTLTNGALLELGQASVPAGTYSQIRLVLAANGNVLPPPNSVLPTGGVEASLNTPSAQQSGLKINSSFDVSKGFLTDLVLDFDACKSVVKAGNSGRYNLKPVISVIPRSADLSGRVVGAIASTTSSAVTVSLQVDSVSVKSTVPDATGRFVLSPIPSGSYDLVITVPDRVTSVLTGVPVSAGSDTTVSTVDRPITIPSAASPTRTVTGTITNPAGTVRAIQTLAGGTHVEITSAAVDPITGAFRMNLPLGAPLLGLYRPASIVPTWTGDQTSAGRFSIDAALGTSHSTRTIDVGAQIPPLVLVLPAVTE